MIKEKQTYLSPETETLVLRFEDSMLITTSTTEQGDIVDGPAWS